MTELTVPARAQAPVTMLDLMETYSRAWADHDPAAIAALHTEDTTFQMHLGTPPVVGRLALRDACADIFATYQNFTAVTRRVICGDGHWLLEWTMCATITVQRGGENVEVPVTVDCVDVVVISPGGLVASKDTYLDVAHVNAVLSQF
jgi:uncharacterized protein (TIGR02246 family)